MVSSYFCDSQCLALNSELHLFFTKHINFRLSSSFILTFKAVTTTLFSWLSKKSTSPGRHPWSWKIKEVQWIPHEYIHPPKYRVVPVKESNENRENPGVCSCSEMQKSVDSHSHMYHDKLLRFFHFKDSQAWKRGLLLSLPGFVIMKENWE